MGKERQKILLTGLWQKKTEEGEIFYTGSLSFGAALLLIKNPKKLDDRYPDVLLFLTSKDQEDLEYAGSQGEIPF
ncbi:hypothetical protein ES703_28655 [subsurface metagenome]